MTDRPAGFDGAFRTDEHARAWYAEGAGIFRIVPAAVAVPRDVEDLISLVKWARATGTSLVPRGAGSGMPGGNVGPGVVVDLTQGFRAPPVVDLERRIASAGAGVTWAELDAAAAAYGLRLPPDPSSGRFCTLGGMAANNAAGARTYKYGAMRSWVEELAFVTSDGQTGSAGPAGGPPGGTVAEQRFWALAPSLEPLRAVERDRMGRVRKDSSGYALFGVDRVRVRDLLVGSEGTLAFLTGVTVRLAPRPASTVSVLVPVRRLEDLEAAVGPCETFRASAVELLDRTFLEFARLLGTEVPADSEAALLIEVEPDGLTALRTLGAGGNAVVATDPEAQERLWSLRHRASPILAALPDTTRSLQVVEDGCVPRPRLAEYIAGLRREAKAHGFQVVIFGHAGDGHLHANVLADVTAPDLADRLRSLFDAVSALQLALGGTPSGEHGDGRLRAPLLAAAFGDGFAAACRHVKDAWDPAGIMNPGVKLGSERLRADVLKVGAGAPRLPAAVAAGLRRIEKEAGWATFRLADGEG